MSWFTVYLNQTKRLASTKQGPIIELSLEQIEKVSRSREPLAEDPSLSLSLAYNQSFLCLPRLPSLI